MPPTRSSSSDDSDNEGDDDLNPAEEEHHQPWYKRWIFGRIYYTFRSFWDGVIGFFLHAFVLFARACRFVSKFVAYAAFYAAPLMLIFHHIGWLTFPHLMIGSYTLGVVAVASTLCTAFLISGLFFYAIARWFDKNIHRAILIPHEREAMTAFSQLMNVSSLDEESYYGQFKAEFHEYVESQVRDENTEGLYETLESFDTIKKKVKTLSENMHDRLENFTDKERNEIVVPRMKSVIYLMVSENLKTNPLLVGNVCQQILLKDFDHIRKLAGRDKFNITFWIGKMRELVANKSKMADVSLSIQEIMDTMTKLWILFDGYYSRATEEEKQTQLLSDLEQSMAAAFGFKIKTFEPPILSFNRSTHSLPIEVKGAQEPSVAPSVGSKGESVGEGKDPKKKRHFHLLPGFFRHKKEPQTQAAPTMMFDNLDSAASFDGKPRLARSISGLSV